MSESLTLPGGAYQVHTPYENLKTMKLLRLQFSVRLKKLRRQYKELKTFYDSETASENFIDQWGFIETTASGACEDLAMYIDHLDHEIEKVTDGILTMEELEAGTGRDALAHYIFTDTEISVHNLTKARAVYDSIIESLSVISRNAFND